MVVQRQALEEARQRRNKIRRRVLIIVGAVLAAIIILFPLYSYTDVITGHLGVTDSSPQSGEWSMFRHDLSRTGSYGNNSVLPSGKLKWTFTTGGGIHSSPTVVDGIVYFGSQDHYLYALDAATGEQKWSFETGSWVESSPIVVGGVVYFGSNDGNIYALNAETGEQLWSYKTVYPVRSSPAVADGIVYVGSDDRHIYAVDAITGKRIWSAQTRDSVVSSPVVADGVVIVGSTEGMCYTVNAKTGQIRIQFETQTSLISSPAIKDKVAYFIDAWGVFYALDITDKSFLWERKTLFYWNWLYLYGIAPRPLVASGFLWAKFLGYGINTASTVALADNNAYCGAGKNMYSIDLSTHDVAWAFKTGNLVTSPAIAGNVLYFGNRDGAVYAIDRTTGEKLWDVAAGDAEITSSPAVVDGTLYIGSHDGTLYAFD